MAAFSGKKYAKNIVRASAPMVWIKRFISDPNWTYIPYLVPSSWSQKIGPNIGEFSFKFNYGRIMNGPEDRDFYFYYPKALNNTYALITSDNFINNSAEILGVYLIQEENVDQYLTPEPAGEQQFVGVELSHLLDRVYIDKSYVKNGLPIDEVLIFNDVDTDPTGLSKVKGNRSLSKEDDNYVFSTLDDNRTQWSNYDILEYLFENFINYHGYIQTPWIIRGETGMLQNIYNNFNFANKSVWTAIGELISKDYGLIYNVEFDVNINRPILKISSTIPSSIANILNIDQGSRTTTYNISLEQNGVLSSNLNFSESSKYDQIVVNGGPIYITSTFSYANNTLEKNWDTSSENSYINIDDSGLGFPFVLIEDLEQIRSEDQYQKVFLNHKIKKDWDGVEFSGAFPGYNDVSGAPPVWVFPDGYNFFPRCDTNSGYLDFLYYSDPYLDDSIFELNLPFDESGTNDKIQAFAGAWIYNDDDLELEENRVNYYKLDNLAARQLPSCSLIFSKNDLSFQIQTQKNYLFGKNSIIFSDSSSGISEDSFEEPDIIKIDYYDIFITATIKTKNNLKLVANAYTTNQVKKVKYIDLPDDLNCHVIHPYTIKSIKNGELEYNEEPEILKNDINQLRYIMELAKAFYGLPKATVSATVVDPLSHITLGDYLTYHRGRFGINWLNSNISEITRNYTEKGIETNFSTTLPADLNFEDISFQSRGNISKIKNTDKVKGSQGLIRLAQNSKSNYSSSQIKRYDKFPEIPVKPTTIYLTEKYATYEQGAGQKYSAQAPDVWWNAIERYSTLSGKPGTPPDSTSGS